MKLNIPSLQARLLNMARAQKIDFQLLLNRLAAEQFLFRLSQSPHSDKFIFKGGALLFYILDTDRKTKDMDFSVQKIKSEVKEIQAIIESILRISADDGLDWVSVEAESLVHPEMDHPGVRLICHFLFGKMKGTIRMDMAMGDIVKPIMVPLERMKYKREPIFGEPFSLLSYPPESIFAEKLQIAMKRRGQNTRMKDYYDLLKLVHYPMNLERLKSCIQDVFTHRKIAMTEGIHFEEEELNMLQTYWEHFIKREKMDQAPKKIKMIIDAVNRYLKKVYAT